MVGFYWDQISQKTNDFLHRGGNSLIIVEWYNEWAQIKVLMLQYNCMVKNKLEVKIYEYQNYKIGYKILQYSFTGYMIVWFKQNFSYWYWYL